MAATRYAPVKLWIATLSAGAVILGAAYFAANPGASARATTYDAGVATQQTLNGQSTAQLQPRAAAPAQRARRTRGS